MQQESISSEEPYKNPNLTSGFCGYACDITIRFCLRPVSFEGVATDTQRVKRKLTAIFSADVKGYSRLMSEDEEATIHTLTAYRETIATLVDLHRGRVVDSPGDNLMAEFASVVDAAQCAVEVQRELKTRNDELPESRKMEFRIGVNLGDVIEKGERIYGDGVNVAARLESLAEAGGICISRTVFDQIKNKLALEYEYLGEHTVKNIAEPVRAYRVDMQPRADGTVIGEKGARPRRWLRVALASSVVLLLGVAGVVLWNFYLRQSAPRVEVSSEEKEVFPFRGPPAARRAGPGWDASHRTGALKHADDSLDPMWMPWEIRKREVQDKVGGVPEKILQLQTLARVKPPSIDAAVTMALKAAQEVAHPLIDTTFHKGRRLTFPDEYETIQSAIDAAKRGDVVVVKPGTYFELIVMKDGVKLVSDSGKDGDELVAVEGAWLKLPRRTLSTIIDGSKAKSSSHGMIDFNPGVGRNTIVDGFTIQNLPKQDHHIPGHAHALNVRGASPVIMNCYVRKNGSTGIGSHVVYADQKSPISKRNFGLANVKYSSEAVIYHNVVCDNLGLGIGCNHFSSPHILGNEVFLNSDAELGEEPSPGMGAKHGAAPTIIGNIVHDNPGGGILCMVGKPQGAHPIDRPTYATVMKNTVYQNGEIRPAISCRGGGSRQMPVRFIGNFVYDAGVIGIGLSEGAVGIIEENVVSGCGASGIAVEGSTALKLNRNEVTGADGPGLLIRSGAQILEMVDNVADLNTGPRFVLRDGTIAESGGKNP